MIKNNRAKAFAILALVVLFTSAIAVSSTKVYEYDFENAFKSGSVDIEINQYELRDGQRVKAERRMVSPGENVSYIPEITNLRSDAYVRVRFEITMDETISKPITADNVLNVGADWLRIDDYFYLTRVLHSGEKSDVFSGIVIPSSWTNEDSSGFKITAHADVIQSADFTPDFKSANPWGSISIEHAKDGDTIEYGKASQLPLKNKTLVYTGESGFEASCEDLFEDFSYYMAGGKYCDVLTIQNKSGNAIKLYFRARTMESNLNDEMKLSISVGGESMYKGNLTSKELNDYRLLKEIKAGDKADFKYEVELPKEALNDLSILKDSVIWEFKVVPEEAKFAVKTGDESRLWLYAGIAAFAAGLAMGIRRRRK